MANKHPGLLVAAMMTALLCTVQAQSVFATSDVGRRSRTYDVLHYRLDVSFDEERRSVLGTASLKIHPLAGIVDSIVLDAAELNIDSVRLGNGGMLRFTNRSPELAVYMDRAYGVKDTIELRIGYSAVPKKGLYFIQPDSSHPKRHWQIWSQGEDMDNHYWFPCYDFPNSKATSEVIATVREKYTLLSNGRLVKETHDPKRKTRTFHWRQEKPHSSYLIMIAAGEYRVVKEQSGKIPLLYYVYPEHLGQAKLIFGRTPEMMSFFQTEISEPYPWDQYAQIIIDDFMWGGMENTTATTMNTSLVVDQRSVAEMSPDPTVAHELAHQWFGDLVTARDWRDLWLNEGFATYFEKMYEEYAHGAEAMQFDMMEMSHAVRASDRTVGRKPIVSSESYATNVYSRGAWVLHMLRDVLGEDAFWNALRKYIRGHAYGNAETRELELAIEDATGQNLSWFFDQWVYKAGFPQVEVRKAWNEDSGTLALTIMQTQTRDTLTGLFKFPLNVEYSGDGWRELDRIWIDRAESTYTVHLPGKPRMVVVDRGYHLLKDLKFERSEEEYLYTLNHMNDVVEKVRCILELQNWPDDPDVVAALRRTATMDGFWGVRGWAVDALKKCSGDSLRESFVQIAAGDPDGRVRASAVGGLKKFQGPETAEFVERLAQTDSSYLVVGACLYALIGIDSTRAAALAGKCLEAESYRDYVRLSAIGALGALQNPAALQLLIRYTDPVYPTDVRTRAATVIGQLGRADTVAEHLLGRILNDGERAVRMAAARSLVLEGGDYAKAALEQRLPIEKDGEIRSLIENGLEAHGTEVLPKEE